VLQKLSSRKSNNGKQEIDIGVSVTEKNVAPQSVAPRNVAPRNIAIETSQLKRHTSKHRY
jgi:hypothetical protein